MEDRPDLIASELSGLAFDSLQQCFRKTDIERMIYHLHAPQPVICEDVFIFIDPAAGGPGSDYGIMSVTRNRGVLVVGTSHLFSQPTGILSAHQVLLLVDPPESVLQHSLSIPGTPTG